MPRWRWRRRLWQSGLMAVGAYGSRGLWQSERRRRRVGVNDARHLRQPIDHMVSDQKGQIQRGQPDREQDQQDIQICGDTVEASQPFLASGAIGRRWFF